MAEWWRDILWNACGKSSRELAQACGIHDSMMGRSLQSNTFQPDDLRNLWLAFGKQIKEHLKGKHPQLAEADLSTIPAIKEAGFEINPPKKIRARSAEQQKRAEEYRRERGLQSREPAATIVVPSSYAAKLAEIDAYHEQLSRPIEEIGERTREIFKYTTARHFLVSSSSALPLLILNPKTESGVDQRKYRFTALDNGLLWALVTPSPAYRERIHHLTNVDLEKAHRGFASGFTELLKSYIDHLKKTGVENPKQVAHLRMQRLEWHEFPHTPLHWTVSLLGERTRHDTRILRAIVRTSFGQSYSYQIFPGGNQDFERDLLRYFTHIIAEHRKEAGKQATKPRAVEARWKVDFCDALLARM